jgi:rhodanese-related sulfurtransferase
MSMATSISAVSLYAQLGLPEAPMPIDVRVDAPAAPVAALVPGSLRGDARRVAEWVRALPRTRPIAIYDSDGGESSRAVVAALVGFGHPAYVLEGGFAAWTQAKLATVRVRPELNSPGGSRWITRERPKIDRLACPWLVRRFIDPDATFFYTAPHLVRSEAETLQAVPFDIADVTFSHRGPRCSFDAFLDEFELHDPVLEQLANIVRAADTDTLAQAREAPGLLAISLGLSVNFTDDVVLLEQAMTIYDAMYAWCKQARAETHGWPQPAGRA